MIHPDIELRFINAIVGYGVVAKTFIPRGTITWVQDDLDRIFLPEDISRLSATMQECLEKYAFTNGRGGRVLCWDHAKYVNHSFTPSCMSTAYDFEVAIRDIYPGEELTDDYGYLNISSPFIPNDEGTDRKVVYPDDILRYHALWDEAIASNLERIQKVHQPLAGLLKESHRQEFEKVCRGEQQLRSIKSCYFDPHAQRSNTTCS